MEHSVHLFGIILEDPDPLICQILAPNPIMVLRKGTKYSIKDQSFQGG